MAIHLFRPADPSHARLSPSWRAWRGVLYVALARLLNGARQLRHSHVARTSVHTILLLVGVATQILLLLTVAYLCDLALALMELWADLARKHLELTL